MLRITDECGSTDQHLWEPWYGRGDSEGASPPIEPISRLLCLDHTVPTDFWRTPLGTWWCVVTLTFFLLIVSEQTIPKPSANRSGRGESLAGLGLCISCLSNHDFHRPPCMFCASFLTCDALETCPGVCDNSMLSHHGRPIDR